jgi:glycosyltransferase involved in cell wall biosynthesis
MPPARLLDISRLLSRAGRRVFTGIDRVEYAYLRHLLALPDPLWGLARHSGGFALVGREGLAALARRFAQDEPWGPPDLRARLRLRQPLPRQRAESDLRRLSEGRAGQGGLARLLAERLPPGTAYLNTGHANLAPEVMAAVRAVPGARIAVLLHDTIPLDHPEFCREGTTAAFAAKLAAAAGADLLILTTAAAAAAAVPHLERAGRVPPMLVAGLGVERPAADPAALPPALDPARPLFVALGTIEPRKNHALLFDLWPRIGEVPGPQLLVAGARGWAGADVMARLDALTAAPGAPVVEAPGLSDGAVAAALDRAAALVFPSLAEGFGLPPLEAAARGCPVLCTPLAATRELLADYPVYADPGDRYQWLEGVRALARAARTGAPRPRPRAAPGWEAHFNAVLSMT